MYLPLCVDIDVVVVLLLFTSVLIIRNWALLNYYTYYNHSLNRH